MACNLNRSITVGVLTALVMTLIIFLWVGPDRMKEMNLSTGNLVLLLAVLSFVNTLSGSLVIKAHDDAVNNEFDDESIAPIAKTLRIGHVGSGGDNLKIYAK